MTRYRQQYDEIYHQLSRAELQKGSAGLEDLSVGPDLFGRDDRWLGFYTREGVRIALEKYGFLRDLEHLGFSEVRIETDTDNPDRHLFRLWSKRPDIDEPLIELTVGRNFLHPRSKLTDRLSDRPLPVLSVDWLLMQNPTAEFTAQRPPLPGQAYPGLGVGAQVLELLRNVCRRLNLAGMTSVPSYFHNAHFYESEFFHFDPIYEGKFQALRRDLLSALNDSICAASWALKWGFVHDHHRPDTPFKWFHELMVDPISEPLQKYFNQRDYRRDCRRSARDCRFHLQKAPLRQRLNNQGIEPFDARKIDGWLREEK